MKRLCSRLLSLALIVPFAADATAVAPPPPSTGLYDEKIHGDSDGYGLATPLPFSFPNPNTLRGTIGYNPAFALFDHHDKYSFTVGAGETVTAINITTTSLDPIHPYVDVDVRLQDASNNHLANYWIHHDVVDHNLLGVQTLDPGDYVLDLYEIFLSYGVQYEFDFVYTGIEKFLTGELVGGASQTQIQGSSYQFQLLSNQIHSVVNGIAAGGMNFVAMPQSSASSSDIQLVSYEDSAIEQVAYQPSRSLRQRTNQGSPVMRGGWAGWVHGYGIGGQVQSNGSVAGLDYGAGGTQLGVYRLTNDGTLIGLFGAYGYQNVETTDGSEADINSGMIGSFLHRGDHVGNYYILAGSVAIDDYKTSRPVGIAGEFNGVQTGLYLERGWTRRTHGLTVQPNVALQYIWVHQDDHTETGVGGATVDDVDAHSLRSLVGMTVNGDALAARKGNWWWTPNARAHWMHEYLDRSTSVTGSIGGSSFAAEGLDLGRDWAVLGVGLSGDRGGAVTLYGNYDLQINDRQTFHTGSGGVVWSR